MQCPYIYNKLDILAVTLLIINTLTETHSGPQEVVVEIPRSTRYFCCCCCPHRAQQTIVNPSCECAKRRGLDSTATSTTRTTEEHREREQEAKNELYARVPNH